MGRPMLKFRIVFTVSVDRGDDEYFLLCRPLREALEGGHYGL